MGFEVAAEVALALTDSCRRIEAGTRPAEREAACQSELAKSDFRHMFRLSPQAAILLARTLSGDSKASGEWLGAWKREYPRHISVPEMPDLAQAATVLPWCWYLQFQFELARPVITLDEDSFGPTDNMIRKERATGIPSIAGSSWKGLLFSTFCALHPDWDAQEQLHEDVQSLFGHADAGSEDEEPRRGVLYFFPSFFDKINLYTLHPLNRKKKTGTPITYEAVPEGGKAWFSLLYSPTDAYAHRPRELRARSERHAELIADAVATTMLQTGFGAKTSSGFGQSKDELPGSGIVFVGGKQCSFSRLVELADVAAILRRQS